MVVRSGFQVQLVDAKTMTPFKEHEKDGKIYVEAEPDAEYFIGIRRISPAGHPVILSYYSVDGHCLGYRQPHRRHPSKHSTKEFGVARTAKNRILLCDLPKHGRRKAIKAFRVTWERQRLPCIKVF